MESISSQIYKTVLIVVNYRTPELVIDCLKSLLPEVSDLDAKVLVIDNDSQDDSVFLINSWLDAHDRGNRVNLIQSSQNGGFASGNNLGFESINAKYYILLNSDSLVHPNSIHQLVETADAHPDAGLVSPRLEWPDGEGQTSCFRFPSPVSEFLTAAKTGMFDRVFPGFVVAMPVQRKIVFPEWTSFACVLIRNDVIRDLGLLDEGYFMYFEDIEYCLRARKSGWKIVHSPESRIVHLRGGSSPVKELTRLNKRLPRYYYESRSRFYYQTYGRCGLTAANLCWWAGRVISRTRQIFGRADKAAVERQWLDIWINWVSPLKPYTHPES